MNTKAYICHGVCGTLTSGSKPAWVPGYVYKLKWYLRTYGWLATMDKVLLRMRKRVLQPGMGVSIDTPDTVNTREEVLHLQPGEWVTVKSKEEIRSTLDHDGKHKGMLWMANMDRFYGERLKVLKRVETMMLESNGEFRHLKNTVLLEGAMCENLYGCDRSCFHFWKEIWLRREYDRQ